MADWKGSLVFSAFAHVTAADAELAAAHDAVAKATG
jgi:hypothetical protein